MIEGEDSCEDLSAPLIISPFITLKDDNGERLPNCRVSTIIDKKLSLEAFPQHPESVLQPLMHDTLRAEDPESIANSYDGTRSQNEACPVKLINRATEALMITKGKRKVHWVDNYGKNIAQVKEFQPSDSEESDEEDQESSQLCNCAIL